MPIIWRYLLSQYLKVFTLCVLSFIAILVVTRLDDIAEFAGLGAPGSFILLFSLYQVPYILPIAIPVSCLISSILLFQTLSSTHELTALRASGFSLRRIISPLLFAGIVLSLLNFYITSELATSSHLESRRLINEVTTVNPLLLLQKKRFFQLKDAYISIDRLQGNNIAHGVVLAKQSKSTGRLSLLTASQLQTEGGQLTGKEVAMISSTNSADPTLFDNLFIENQQLVSTDASQSLQLLGGGGWRLNSDHLTYALLVTKRDSEVAALQVAFSTNAPPEEIAHIQGLLSQSRSEFSRRFSMALSVFTFTLLGCAFGIRIHRGRSNKGILIVTLLSAIALATFFLAKNANKQFALATALYLVPHLLIVLCSIWTLRRASLGVE